MALRFLLVSVVAGMGIEMPSGQDVTSWTRSGRDWIIARIADLPGASGCERADEGSGRSAVAEATPSAQDLAFEAVVEGMASNFSADLAALETDSTTVATVEIFHELPLASWRDPEPEIAPFPILDETRAESLPASRVERIAVAVHLTRQAVSAWASLFQVPAVQVATGGADGSL